MTLIEKIIGANITKMNISVTNPINKGPYLLNTILNDKNVIFLNGGRIIFKFQTSSTS